jgi:hypothetical protein
MHPQYNINIIIIVILLIRKYGRGDYLMNSVGGTKKNVFGDYAKCIQKMKSDLYGSILSPL